MNTRFFKQYLFLGLFLLAAIGNVKANTNDLVDEEQEQNIVDIFDARMLEFYSSKLAATIDPYCVSGENPQFTEEEYRERLQRIPNVIEMPHNSLVQAHINLYTQRRREQLSNMLALSRIYFPLFERVLEAYGLPLELRYIPVIESALNPSAVSRAGAAGLWQFMPATGRAYGLTINNLVDERRCPIKSTYAAARYFRDLYNIYGDWHLVLAAYNFGQGNVNRAIRRSGGVRDYWALFNFLPRETRGYVPVFIAAAYAMNFYSYHNICPADIPQANMITDTIMISERIHLQQVADVLNITIEDLRFFNPQYRRDIIPGNITPSALRLPINYIGAFIDHQDSIFNHRAAELVHNMRTEVTPATVTARATTGTGGRVYYRVRSGDTLGRIASRHRVTVSSIQSWNNLTTTTIRVGQRLIIYPGRTATATAAATATSTTTHTVRQGESLWSISQQFQGVTVDDIRRANNLRNNTIRAGQVLRIPARQ